MENKRPMPYPLRMPQDLRERLETARNESGRSLNAEIIARLEKSFDAPLEELEAAESVSKRLEDQLNQVRKELALMAKSNAEASEFIREMREMDRERKREGEG